MTAVTMGHNLWVVPRPRFGDGESCICDFRIEKRRHRCRRGLCQRYDPTGGSPAGGQRFRRLRPPGVFVHLVLRHSSIWMLRHHVRGHGFDHFIPGLRGELLITRPTEVAASRFQGKHSFSRIASDGGATCVPDSRPLLVIAARSGLLHIVIAARP